MTKIYKNYGEFCAREDKASNGVSAEFAGVNPGFERENDTNENCWNCRDCSDCRGKQGEKTQAIKIPIVKNIHSKVLEAVTKTGKLEMDTWHSCGTTHCRGGWVITLAGEAGAELEKQTSSDFAAMAIYHKSSPIRVSPIRFYERNEVAMADINRCAKEEAESK